MEQFGVVTDAPAFIGWTFEHEEWRAVAGGETRGEAGRKLIGMAGGRQGIILRRGDRPAAKKSA